MGSKGGVTRSVRSRAATARIKMASECGKMVYLPQRHSEALAVIGPTPGHDRTTLEVAGMSSLPRMCLICQNPIPTNTRRTYYCSDGCAQRARDERYNPAVQMLVGTGTQGAIGELVVCVDLLRRGYDVYRAMSPSCPCDLVAIKDGVTYRVEVKTARYNSAGQIALRGGNPKPSGEIQRSGPRNPSR